jgi:hypothetical protein
VTFPYVLVFLVLLVAYMVYSQWVRMDSRYPIAGALVLLVATAVVDAAGNVPAANTLAEFVFILLAAGVVLLLLDHARDARRSAASDDSGLRPGQTEPAEPSQDRQGPAEHSLDRAEQHPVALVNAPGQDHDEDEQPGDPEPDRGQAP